MKQTVEITLRKSLENLIKSCIPNVKNVSEYVKQLRQMVEKIDERKFKKQSEIFKALSDPLRLKILILLSKKSMCVCEIVAALNLTQPNASYHLNLLENVGLVKSKRVGKWIFYSIEKHSHQFFKFNINN